MFHQVNTTRIKAFLKCPLLQEKRGQGVHDKKPFVEIWQEDVTCIVFAGYFNLFFRAQRATDVHNLQASVVHEGVVVISLIGGFKQVFLFYLFVQDLQSQGPMCRALCAVEMLSLQNNGLPEFTGTCPTLAEVSSEYPLETIGVVNTENSTTI